MARHTRACQPSFVQLRAQLSTMLDVLRDVTDDPRGIVSRKSSRSTFVHIKLVDTHYRRFGCLLHEFIGVKKKTCTCTELQKLKGSSRVRAHRGHCNFQKTALGLLMPVRGHTSHWHALRYGVDLHVSLQIPGFSHHTELAPTGANTHTNCTARALLCVHVEHQS